jgi:hypothetical protein
MRADATRPCAGAAFRLAVTVTLCLFVCLVALPTPASSSMDPGPTADTSPPGSLPEPGSSPDGGPAPAQIVAVPQAAPDLPMPDVPIVFASRNRMPTLDGVHVGPALDIIGREYTPGGRLLVWWPDGRVTDLTAGARIYDVQQPDVSFDGTRIVFSGVEQNKAQWHLYEIGLDGSGLRQLTGEERGFVLPSDPLSPGRNESVFGRWGDFAPAYLPDGRIMFVSTRYATLSASCGQRGLNLYVLDPATGAIHRRTTVRSGALDPSVMASGAVVYSNWVDLMSVPALDGPGIRPLEADYSFAPSFWGIWAISPDGTNNGRIVFPTGGLGDYGGLYQPRELPDGDIVATVRNSGGLLGDTITNALVRVRTGLRPPHGLRFIGDPGTIEAPHALAAAPLPDGRIVCSYTYTPTLATDWQGEKSADYDFGLQVLDASMEHMRPLFNDPRTDELDAMAVIPRRVPVIADMPDVMRISDDPRIDYGLTARLINRNVYADMPLQLVDVPSPKAGTIARLDLYDDSQVYTVDPDFPYISKQMPRFLGSFPVDASGAFTATVPTDRSLMYILMNHSGVAARTLNSPTSPGAQSGSVIHFFGHDYLRPHGDFVCTGCHRGHMIDPANALASSANLARLATATASSTRDEFTGGAWRATDLRPADGYARWAWATNEGPGAWVQLDWPGPVTVDRILIHPLRSAGCRVTAATLTLSDDTRMELPSAPVDGNPLVIPLVPPRPLEWLRVTVDDAATRLVGVAEIVVNGPADVHLPDVPPPPPTRLAATQGAIYLTWERTPDPTVSGYKIHYGTATGQYTSTLDVGDVTSFILQDRARDGETYYFAAKAYNLVGTESLTFSDEVTATAHAPVVLGIEPDRGWLSGGTAVTIKGEHFSPLGVRIRIGGHVQSARVVDEETIAAVTRYYYSPATVDVIVANIDDQTGILPKAYTFYRPERAVPTVYLPVAARKGR